MLALMAVLTVLFLLTVLALLVALVVSPVRVSAGHHGGGSHRLTRKTGAPAAGSGRKVTLGRR